MITERPAKLNNYAWVIADLQAKIKENWNPPSAVASGGVNKTVEIRLKLLADGTIKDPIIIKSSGSKAIDQSVLHAVKSLKTKIMPPKENLEFVLDFNLF